jgi:hypothetical protein
VDSRVSGLVAFLGFWLILLVLLNSPAALACSASRLRVFGLWGEPGMQLYWIQLFLENFRLSQVRNNYFSLHQLKLISAPSNGSNRHSCLSCPAKLYFDPHAPNPMPNCSLHFSHPAAFRNHWQSQFWLPSPGSALRPFFGP